MSLDKVFCTHGGKMVLGGEGRILLPSNPTRRYHLSAFRHLICGFCKGVVEPTGRSSNFVLQEKFCRRRVRSTGSKVDEAWGHSFNFARFRCPKHSATILKQVCGLCMRGNIKRGARCETVDFLLRGSKAWWRGEWDPISTREGAQNMS